MLFSRAASAQQSPNPPGPCGRDAPISPQAMQSFPILPLRAQQNLRFCRRLHIGALRSPLSPFAPSQRYLPVPLPKDLPPRGRGTARRRWKEFLARRRWKEFSSVPGGRSSRPPPVKGVYALNPHSILTAYSGCNSFAPKPSIFQPTVEIWSSGSAVPALPAGLTITRGFAPLRLVTP